MEKDGTSTHQKVCTHALCTRHVWTHVQMSLWHLAFMLKMSAPGLSPIHSFVSPQSSLGWPEPTGPLKGCVVKQLPLDQLLCMAHVCALQISWHSCSSFKQRENKETDYGHNQERENLQKPYQSQLYLDTCFWKIPWHTVETKINFKINNYINRSHAFFLSDCEVILVVGQWT